MNQVPFLSRSFVVAALLAMMAPWGTAIAAPGNVSDITGGNVSDITGGNVSDITGGNVSDITGGDTSNGLAGMTQEQRNALASNLETQFNICTAGGDCAAFFTLLEQASSLGLL